MNLTLDAMGQIYLARQITVMSQLLGDLLRMCFIFIKRCSQLTAVKTSIVPRAAQISGSKFQFKLRFHTSVSL